MALMPFEPTTGKYPAAYIRESSEDAERDLDLQKAGQREDIARLAERDGIELTKLHWYDDWSRSGGQTGKRPGMRRLIADIRAGSVTVVYARSLDRLTRNEGDFSALWHVADRIAGDHEYMGRPCHADHSGTTILTERERDISPWQMERSMPVWDQVNFALMFARRESRIGQERSRAAVATKIREGQSMGRKGYGEDPPWTDKKGKRHPGHPGERLDLLLEAWDRTRSFNGTAGALNDGKVPTRVKGATWDGLTVARIVRRHRIVPKVVRQGVAATAPRIFSGLLRCSCGDTMTSMPRRAGVGRQKTETIAYYCRRAHTTPGHPRPYVIAESKVRAWTEHELADVKTVLGERKARKRAKNADQQRRGALLATREGIGDAYAAGAYGAVGSPPAKATLARKLTKLDADLEGLEAAETVHLLADGNMTQVPYVDWTEDPGEVNERLRTLWTAVELGHVDSRLVPVKPQWVPGVWEDLFGVTDAEIAKRDRLMAAMAEVES